MRNRPSPRAGASSQLGLPVLGPTSELNPGTRAASRGAASSCGALDCLDFSPAELVAIDVHGADSGVNICASSSNA